LHEARSGIGREVGFRTSAKITIDLFQGADRTPAYIWLCYLVHLNGDIRGDGQTLDRILQSDAVKTSTACPYGLRPRRSIWIALLRYARKKFPRRPRFRPRSPRRAARKLFRDAVNEDSVNTKSAPSSSASPEIFSKTRLYMRFKYRIGRSLDRITGPITTKNAGVRRSLYIERLTRTVDGITIICGP